MAEVLPFYVVMVVGISETFALLLLGFKLFNDQIDPRHALLLGTLASLVNYWVRNMGVIFGVQTLANAVIIIVLYFWMTKKNIWKIASATVSGIVVLASVEIIEFYIIWGINSSIIDLRPQMPWINILMVFPVIIVMYLFYVAAKKCNFTLFNSSFIEMDT